MSHNNICLFASYSPTNTLTLDVQHYLQQLSTCGWKIYLTLAGQPPLPSETLQFCQQHKITPYPRANRGLDFGAWQELINQKVTQNAAYILLTNDSVFGPVYPLQPVFKQMLVPEIDLWGMVASFERNWHLQSWFLCFNHAFFHSQKIQEFFSQPFTEMNKPEIIQNGELKLGQILQQIPDLTCRSAWTETKSKIFRHKERVNPMHLDWYSVLHSGMVPFLKKELIRDNHFGIFWLNHYRHLLKDNAFFPLQYIDSYLTNFPNRPRPFVPWWKRFKYLFTTYDRKLAWEYIMKQGVSCPILP